MDELFAKLLGTAAAPLIEALNRNSDNLERVIAGQEAAMAKLEGATGGTSTRKPRQTAAEKKAAEEAAATPTPEASPAPAATPAPEPATAPATAEPSHPLLAKPNGETAPVKNPKSGVTEDTPTANYRAADFSREQVKNEFIGWLGETDNADERKDRAAFVASIGQHFGVKKPFDPSEGLVDDEQRKQTLFFLRRKREGLKVDFAADYDFDADPLADQTQESESAEDDFDALG